MAPPVGILEPATAPDEMALMRTELRRLHFRWQHLTKEEGAAIAAADWRQVDQIEAVKEHLQQDIITAEQALQKTANQRGDDPSAVRREFHEIVEVSLQLESRNHELLAAQMRQARSRFLELRQTGHNLRQLHQAYARQPNSVWQSYS